MSQRRMTPKTHDARPHTTDDKHDVRHTRRTTHTTYDTHKGVSTKQQRDKTYGGAEPR